jgi:hypothetical protein
MHALTDARVTDMNRIANVAVVLAVAASLAGCGAQQSIEHATSTARHVVEEGERAKKKLEQEKAKLEKDAKELKRKGKEAQQTLERERAKSGG